MKVLFLAIPLELLFCSALSAVKSSFRHGIIRQLALLIGFSSLAISGCSVFGHSTVNIAPYTVLEKEDNFELRHYERLVLVSTPMLGGMEDQKAPFHKLFDYISGKNQETQEIPMTAPVLLNQADQKTETMSFVLPTRFTIDEAPQPQDPAVNLETLTDYTITAITFSGFLNQDTINQHQALLEQWVKRKGYIPTGQVKAAGYNPPFTIPALRRNEVFIPVLKP